MKIIRPMAITDTKFTASNVAENDYTAWSAATTYVAGDHCIVTTTDIHKIYLCLPLVGVEVMTIDVSPATDWAAGDLITGATSGKTCLIVAKLTATTYQVISRSGAFTLGEIIGVLGIAAKLADQGAANPTFATAANLNNDPVVDTARTTPRWWKEVSYTNRWKAFDNKVGSQTSQATSITYQLTPGEVFNSISFRNLDAVTVRIVLTDPAGPTVVYDETVDLQTTVITGTTLTYDWYTYFFSSIVRVTGFEKFDIPPYLNGVLDITITNTGGTAKVGGIKHGLKTTLGTTQPEPKPTFGTHDYSQKTVDDYGVYSIVPGASSKRMECTIRVPNSSIDEVERLFALYQSEILVWVASDILASMSVCGFLKDHNAEAGLNFTTVSLTIEGLT
jgi:hypothetical protein